MPDGFEGIQDHSRKVQELAVAQFYREWLVKRGIPLELAEIAHLRVDVANNLNRQLDADTKEGKKHPWLAPNEYGVYIPFLDLNGDPIPGVYAIRRSGTEMPKYLTPGGSRGVYAYLAPIYNWNEIARDTHYNIVIVEGPPKALTMMQYLPSDTVVIAIPGVTMWDVASNMGQVPRGLEKFVWAGRKVAVLFDRDTKESAIVNVSRARSRIVDVLLKLHADAYVIDLPDDGSSKTGPDDWLLAGGKWEDLVWQPQDIQSHPIRMLRAQTMVCTNPVSAIDLISGQVLDYFKWKTLHKNKFILVPDPSDPKKTKKIFATDNVWDDPDREEVAGVDFQPGKRPMSVFHDGGRAVLNVWKGWQDLSAQPNPAAWDKFLRFLHHVIPNEAEAKWVLQFMAHAFQRPEQRPQHMVILVSVMTGTGKSTLARVWTECMGRYGCKIRPSEFFSGFNMFLYQNIGLWVDELKDGEHKQSQVVEILKDLVTTPRVLCNEKHAPAFSVAVYNRIIATTNDLSALKVNQTERRINMIQCIEKSVHGFPEMHEIARQLNGLTDEDRQGIVDGFMSVDLEGYEHDQRSLQTEALEQARDLSRWGIEEASDKVLEALSSKAEKEDCAGVWVSNDFIPGLFLDHAKDYEMSKFDNARKALVTRAKEMGWLTASVSRGSKGRGQWFSPSGVAYEATERRLHLDGGGKKYV